MLFTLPAACCNTACLSHAAECMLHAARCLLHLVCFACCMLVVHIAVACFLFCTLRPVCCMFHGAGASCVPHATWCRVRVAGCVVSVASCLFCTCCVLQVASSLFCACCMLQVACCPLHRIRFARVACCRLYAASCMLSVARVTLLLCGACFSWLHAVYCMFLTVRGARCLLSVALCRFARCVAAVCVVCSGAHVSSRCSVLGLGFRV